MIDLYLTAPTEDALATAIPFARGVDQNNNPCWLLASARFCFDPIGSIITPAVFTTNSDGSRTITTAATSDGLFHANLRLIDETLQASVPSSVITSPTPTNLPRVWA